MHKSNQPETVARNGSAWALIAIHKLEVVADAGDPGAGDRRRARSIRSIAPADHEELP